MLEADTGRAAAPFASPIGDLKQRDLLSDGRAVEIIHNLNAG